MCLSVGNQHRRRTGWFTGSAERVGMVNGGLGWGVVYWVFVWVSVWVSVLSLVIVLIVGAGGRDVSESWRPAHQCYLPGPAYSKGPAEQQRDPT